MTTNDKQRNSQIYYRPLKQWIEVTPKQKKDWERFIDTKRKAQQRHGICCIPYKKSYQCDGLCEKCEYRVISDDVPSCLSIDCEEELERNGTHSNTFLSDESLTTEINLDNMLLNSLLEELKAVSPESYQILMLVAEGISERECARRMNMPRNTFTYKRNKLLNSLRKKF
ncbi:MAG: hypothetical protein ACI4C7_04795 [Clostridia bacterium]